MATLEIHRTNDSGGRFRHLHVNVDGQRVASLRPNDHAAVALAAGQHNLVGSMDWARSQPLQLDVPDDGVTRVEVSFPFWAGLIGTFVTPKRAIKARVLG